MKQKQQKFNSGGVLPILEMSVGELVVAVAACDRNSVEWFYGEGLKLFLTNRLIDLHIHVTQKSSAGWGILHDLLLLRLQTRESKINHDILIKSSSYAQSGASFAGEAAFVVAAAYEALHDEYEAKRWWLIAQEKLAKVGCLRKSAKAFHNAIATESRINPNRRLIAEYQEAILLCEKTGELVARANAQLNLSREYQIMGALNLSLRYANAAVDLSAREQPYGLQHMLSLGHRCHVLIDLGLSKLALVDFEELQCSAFPEAHLIVDVLSQLLHQKAWISPAICGASSEPATWTERRHNIQTGKPQGKLTDLENDVIEALSHGPKDRHELMDELFKSGDALSKENRLKQLMHRLRKKSPDLIGYHEKKYFISDPSLPSKKG